MVKTRRIAKGLENALGISAKSAQEIASSMEAMSSLDGQVLTDVYQHLHMKENPESNIKMWDSNVAPKHLIRSELVNSLDLKHMHHTDIGDLHLIIRAISGRAQNGHGVFRKAGAGGKPLIFHNTTTRHVLETVAADSAYNALEFGKETQSMINDIGSLCMQIFDTLDKKGNDFSALDLLYTFGPKPVAQMDCLNGIQRNLLSFLQGFYFAANMDTYRGVRDQGFEKYGFNMGGGECVPLDGDALKDLNIGLYDLSTLGETKNQTFFNHLTFPKRIEVLQNLGVIVGHEPHISSEHSWRDLLSDSGVIDIAKNPEVFMGYVRDSHGKGCSDDTALVLAGFLKPQYYRGKGLNPELDVFSRFIGAYFADKIDTLEKDSRYLVFGGQDQLMGQLVNQKFKEACEHPAFRNAARLRKTDSDLVSLDDVIDFTMAAANTNLVVHSSQRWFSSETRRTCALNEYMTVVK
ncbi:MAG: hypothetical protein ACMXYK_04005, partial [Candidatus Woesearchaeota archaeon]